MGKNTRMPVRHSRTPSSTPQLATPQHSRPNYKRRGSTTSEADSVVTSASEMREEALGSFASAVAASSSASFAGGLHLDTTTKAQGPPTPTASVVSSASAMFPPREAPTSARSRRSSFSSTTNAPSPSVSSRGNLGRSPSPMPPLPAIRTPAATPSWASVKLYGDEGFTNFFRRLTFSPDGGLLLTPAGQFEDPSVVPGAKTRSDGQPDDPPVQPRKPSNSAGVPSSSSSVFIYSRANFARPPVAHLPGHKTASIAVRFSPVLYELRPNVAVPGGKAQSEVRKIVIEKGKDHDVELDLGSYTSIQQPTSKPVSSSGHSSSSGGPNDIRPPPSPAPSSSSRRAGTPASHSQSASNGTASVFALPYRMLFAVATQDTVMIYDTQQSGPICMFTNLHYSAFTDVAWYVLSCDLASRTCCLYNCCHVIRAPDGQSLMLASSDGYCSIVIFDEFLPLYHTQQHNIQLQAIASSVSTPQHTPHPLPWSNQEPGTSLKRNEPPRDDEPPIPMPPLISVTPDPTLSASSASVSASVDVVSEGGQPKKKKRRIQPTHIGGID